MEGEKKKVKFISYTWWIFMLIGIIIGLASSDSRYKDSQPIAFAFIGATNGALIGALIGYLMDKAQNSNIARKLNESIESHKAEQELNKNIKNSMNIYHDAVHRFQFLSNDTLKKKFEAKDSEETNNMEQLALEEEMVKRGLLDYSPMHEKMEKLKGKFK
ncbi:hypothetical protein [Flagellimonas flava]|uniref:hypothetical protein n=1 Tax=Flagellimonas flava TaxID=570519 RepID=UPI003D64D9E5